MVCLWILETPGGFRRNYKWTLIRVTFLFFLGKGEKGKGGEQKSYQKMFGMGGNGPEFKGRLCLQSDFAFLGIEQTLLLH